MNNESLIAEDELARLYIRMSNSAFHSPQRYKIVVFRQGASVQRQTKALYGPKLFVQSDDLPCDQRALYDETDDEWGYDALAILIGYYEGMANNLEAK